MMDLTPLEYAFAGGFAGGVIAETARALWRRRRAARLEPLTPEQAASEEAAMLAVKLARKTYRADREGRYELNTRLWAATIRVADGAQTLHDVASDLTFTGRTAYASELHQLAEELTATRVRVERWGFNVKWPMPDAVVWGRLLHPKKKVNP